MRKNGDEPFDKFSEISYDKAIGLQEDKYMWDTVLDSFLDTLKLFPFLFVLYILIELLEHKTRIGKPSRALSGKYAPVLGGAMGLVPMCGFSVMAAKLYERRFLTIGTLITVFIATNDEALLVLAVAPMPVVNKIVSIALLCALKLAIGIGAGYLIDALLKRRTGAALPEPPCGQAEEHDHDDHDGHDHGHESKEGEPHVCEHKHENNLQLYLLSPLLHALRIAAVIFAFNLAFGLLFYYIGEENVIGFLQGSGLWFQPLVCCVIGLIPNCASSVVLAETYIVGGIAFGSLLGGLMTNAGLGVLVLFKSKAAFKRNLCILGFMLAVGVITGYLVNVIALFV